MWCPLACALVLPVSPGRAATPAEPEPVEVSAQRLFSELGRKTTAENEVSLIQGGLRLDTDWLEVLHVEQLATANGHVVLHKDGGELRGTQAQIRLDTHEGFVIQPSYRLLNTGARGKAQRIDFVGSDRLTAQNTSYTSCRTDDPETADWVLTANRLSLDFEHNDGVAVGAVLRFKGVPLLAAPVLSFPATGERKSGWLPPTLYPFDTRNGFQAELPYYFNLAPNYDLTVTPGLWLRRGMAVGSEFRYLLDQDEGRLAAHWLPDDRMAGQQRYSVLWRHEGEDGGGLLYHAAVEHASDDSYWKDFSRQIASLTPRLLAQDLWATQRWALDGGTAHAYARVQGWRTLQNNDAVILPPYQRLPQLGWRAEGVVPTGELSWSLQAEYNRFVLRDAMATDTRPDGERVHLLGSLQRSWDPGWGWITPRLSLNAASYRTDTAMADGRTQAGRSIPTVSIDSGLRFERYEQWLGRAVYQTLEPRLHYTRTPWRNQDSLPNFDTSAVDFNELSIYSDNAFTGVDFVTDVHQVTLGATSRWFDNALGAELLRLGVAQSYLFSAQRVTAARLTASGLAAESGQVNARFSDLLLFGATTLLPDWVIEGKLQYNADLARTSRSVFSARWQPEPFHTLSATYRYTRNLSEQVELGWQWPIYRGEDPGDGRCVGTLYGVGRVNYGMKDRRISDTIAGVEYDAGCWIGRVVAKRVSTGQTEATTQLMLQLELVGLSRLGTNPLKTLKDNIPGYQLLRDDASATSTGP